MNYYIIVLIINIILIKNSINNILFEKKRKKRFLSTVPVTLVETGFAPGPFEFPTYLSNYRIRPNDLGYSKYLCMPVFLIAYNRSFDHKLFLTLFYRM